MRAKVYRVFLSHTGPMITYQAGKLHIEDLNPEWQTTWRITRAELIGMGWRCIWAALRTSQGELEREATHDANLHARPAQKLTRYPPDMPRAGTMHDGQIDSH